MSSTNASLDVDNRHAYMAAVAAMTVVAVLVAWLRMGVRAFIVKKIGSDDWTMFGATFLAILTNGVLIQAYKLGLGRHIEFVVADGTLTELLKFVWMVQATTMFALYFVRLSISLTFLRIVPKSRTWFRGFIWFTIIGLTASNIYISIIYFAQCIPLEKVWRPETPGWCMKQDALQAGPWIYQAVSILADIIIVTVAATLFARLNVAFRTRIVIILLCSMGVFTCVCAIVKTVLLEQFYNDNPDKSWIIAPLGLFCALELCVGMVCGCLPCLRPLFDKTVGRSSSGQKQLTWSYGYRGSSSKKRAIRGETNSIASSEEGLAMGPTAIQKTTEIEVVSTLRMPLDTYHPDRALDEIIPATPDVPGVEWQEKA